MKILVISYSFTGNNRALANSLAAALHAEHICIAEQKPRTMFTIFLDMLFNRTPLIMPLTVKLSEQDLVIFIAPVWMGKAATPLRACFKEIRKNAVPYVFASLSGGSGGANSKLEADLLKWTGSKPLAVTDQHLVDLLPAHAIRDAKTVAAFRPSAADIKVLTGNILQILEKKGLTEAVLV